jgi:hypothetical protein
MRLENVPHAEERPGGPRLEDTLLRVKWNDGRPT